MAIVIPFTSKDVEQATALIRHWSHPLVYPPIQQQQHLPVDLIFYFNLRVDLDLDISHLQTLKTVSATYKHVFRNIHFVSANLSPDDDMYPNGPSNMFFQLFYAEHKSFQTDYNAAFWMEPDNWPCQPFWLSALYAESLSQSGWWIRGSILRDTKSNPDYATFSFRKHINGNALYKFGDPAFRYWIINTVELEFRLDPEKYVGSWDIAVQLILENKTPWAEYVNMGHRFVYTGIIQNWYRGSVNKTEICQRDKETYFVHGRNVFY